MHQISFLSVITEQYEGPEADWKAKTPSTCCPVKTCQVLSPALFPQTTNLSNPSKHFLQIHAIKPQWLLLLHSLCFFSVRVCGRSKWLRSELGMVSHMGEVDIIVIPPMRLNEVKDSVELSAKGKE